MPDPGRAGPAADRRSGGCAGCVLLLVVVAVIGGAVGVRAMSGNAPWDPGPGPIDFGTSFDGDTLELNATVATAVAGRPIVFDAHLSRRSPPGEQLHVTLRLRDASFSVTDPVPMDDLGGDVVRGRLPSYVSGTCDVEVADAQGDVLAKGSIVVTDAAPTGAP